MILGLIINFSIMFTFIIFSYFIFEYFREKQPYFNDLQPLIVGFVSVVIALLLMKNSLPLGNGFYADMRNICVLVASLLGGPIATLISATFIGIFRIFMFDSSTVGLILGINTIFVGIVIALFTYRKKMDQHSVFYYLMFITLESALCIFILEDQFIRALRISVFYILLHVVGFYMIYVIFRLFENQFNHIRTIEKLAETDYVTNLANTRKLNGVLQQTIDNKQPFTLLVIDIDQFKILNRTYGHVYGDEILLELATRLTQFAHERNAYAARLSGDEFCLLCYDAAPAVGITYAQQFLLQMKDNPIHLSNGVDINISISIGASSYPQNGDELQLLIQTVNHAATIATDKGPNAVIHTNQLAQHVFK